MVAFKKSLMVLLTLVFVSAGTVATQAQAQVYRGTNRSMRQLILRIENRTDVFSNTVNAQYRSRVNAQGSRNLVDLTRDFNAAVDRLRTNFDQRRSTTADVQEVLNRA